MRKMSCTVQSMWAWRNFLCLTLAVAGVTLCAMPASAKQDLRDWAGSWGCHTQSDFHGADDPFEFVQIQNMDVSRTGKVTGNLLQAQPGPPPIKLICTIAGEASNDTTIEGYLRLDVDLECEGIDQPIEASAECVGVLNSKGTGYQGMYCIDLTEELGFTLEALSLCERQELGKGRLPKWLPW